MLLLFNQTLTNLYALPADSDVLTFTGSPAAFTYERTLIADVGVLMLTGADAELTYTKGLFDPSVAVADVPLITVIVKDHPA